ncbi:MAG: Os1348 family NHLP clan protein [Anaerolineae bacterium]|jgi:hypothetical protein
MATDKEIDRLVEQALIDDDFRHHLLDDPRSTAKTLEIRLTDDQVAHIKEIDPKEADRVAEDFQSAGEDSGVRTLGLW